MKYELFLQYEGKEIGQNELLKEFKEMWKSKNRKIKDVAALKLYYNAEEHKCYYVVNETESGNF